MQLRVLNALRRARDGETADTTHERFTLSLASEVLLRDRDEEWSLIESPGRMRIETVDAFGAGIARSLPLSSGLGGVNTTSADAEITSIYAQAARATLDYLAAADDAAGAAVERVLRHLDNDASLYISYMARMLGSREQWLAITGSGTAGGGGQAAARQRLESNIADVITRQLALVDSLLPPICRQDLSRLLRYAGENLVADGKSSHLLASFASGGDLPEPVAADRNRWHAIADLLLTKQGEWRKQANRNDGFPPDGKAEKSSLGEIIESMHELHDLRDCLHRTRTLPDPHYTDEQWAVLVALLDLLPLAVAELRRLFSERGVTDHNEVALSAGRALGGIDDPGDMVMMLDYRVQHLLVDEMQDTSIGQYDLLKKLTAGWTPDDGRTIFCVGDPMQSIYRFRDAEVGEFLLAKERGIGSTRLEPLTLRRNFRSGENLVHWFNTIFLQVMPLKDDVAVGAIRYTESTPVEEKAGQGEHRVHPLFDATPEVEAACALQVIEDCLAASDNENVAILVRSRTQLTDLLRLLRQSGIEYQAVEIDRLTDLPEVIDLIALTRALCHDGDRLAWLALLRGPFAGLRWNDILALVRNDRTHTIIELLGEADRIEALSPDGHRRVERLLDVLRVSRARHATGSLSDRIERAWYKLGGPALLHNDEQLENVYRYFRTLDKLDVAGTLDDIVELERKLDDERVSSTVTAGCRLQVMTMHKAKGLQFDHVILPSLGRMTRGSNREVLSWLNLADSEGHSEMLISPVGPRAALQNDPLHQFIEATEKEKTRMELDRLLYVACTRARRSLHLIGSVGVTADGSDYRRPDARSLLARLWPAIEQDYRDAFVAATCDNDAAGYDDENEHLVLPVLSRFSDAWQPPVAPTLPGRASAAVSPDDQDAVEFYWVGAAARHAGTIVHRWLQRISERRVRVNTNDLQRLRPVSRRWAASLGVPVDELDEVCDRTERALKGILSHEQGRWVLNGEGSAELAISGIYDGRTESIVIDRVRVAEDGVHWIIDYKTSSHEGGDLEQFLRQEADRYRDQLGKYAAIYSNMTGAKVRTALYFPLLQAFCEVGQADR
jgi:ATP-dependent exoDNAse (exonuclease V) beta subunit